MKKVYVDLDGVLADFVSGFSSLYGISVSSLSYDELKEYKKEFSEKLFFRNLPVFEWAKDFMKALVELGYDVEILTAVSEFNSEVNASHKEEWVKEHFPGFKFNWVVKSHEKAKFASEDVVLIDDREKSIKPWIAAGGKGILHSDLAVSYVDLLYSRFYSA